MSRHSPKEIERIKRIAASADFGKPVAQGSLAVPANSTPRPLFVSARIFNEPGIYRVLEIGIEDGHKNNSYDVAKLLRKLADWVEKEKA